MALTHLGNCFYAKAVEEGYSAFKVGRADNDVAMGDRKWNGLHRDWTGKSIRLSIFHLLAAWNRQ